MCNLDTIKARRLSHVVSSLSLPIPTYFMSSSHHIHTHGIGSGYLVPFSSVALGLIFSVVQVGRCVFTCSDFRDPHSFFPAFLHS